jgi:hypothetical protein
VRRCARCSTQRRQGRATGRQGPWRGAGWLARAERPWGAQAADERATDLAGAFAGVASLNVRAAAEELTRQGMPTPSGGRWHPTQVVRVRASLAE